VFTWRPSATSTSTEEATLRNGRLWVASTIRAPKSRYVIGGRLRAGFVQQTVDEISSMADGRAALLLSRSGTILASGKNGPPVGMRGASLRSHKGRPGGGDVTGVSGPDGPMLGLWGSLASAPGLGWRILVLEPRYAGLERARSALLPAALTVLVSSLVAVSAAFVFAGRLLRPLRAFEVTSRAVASGMVVRPVVVDRDDEVARVAEAFNAMLLRLNALSELSQLLARSTRPDEVLDGVLGATARLLGEETSASVFLLDEAGSKLVLAGFRGIAPLPAHASLLAGDPVCRPH
jgi:HAMP domain-containing protein